MAKPDKQEDFENIAKIILTHRMIAYNNLINELVLMYGDDMKIAAEWLADTYFGPERFDDVGPFSVEMIVSRAR